MVSPHSDAHQDQYKPNKINVNGSRARKAKREEYLSERCNLTEDAAVQVGDQLRDTMKLDDIVANMKCQFPELQLEGMKKAREILSLDLSPPIDQMISRGIVPICVQFLQVDDNPALQFEATWALTKIASGISERTRCVIEHNAVPHLIALLKSNHPGLTGMSLWCLGNIATAASDILLQHGIIDAILNVAICDMPMEALQDMVRLVLNLYLNDNPMAHLEQMKRLLPPLMRFLTNVDRALVADTCWAMVDLTQKVDMMQAVIDEGVVPLLVNLLQSDDIVILEPVLQSVANIVSGPDQHVDDVISAGGLHTLSPLLEHPRKCVFRTALFIVRNLACGNPTQIQEILDSGVFHQIRAVLQTNDLIAQQEIAFMVLNFSTSATPEQIMDLIDRYKILEPFMDLLDSKDSATIALVLEGLENFLSRTAPLGITEVLVLMIEDLGGLDKVEELERHEDEKIYQTATAVVEKYFINKRPS